MVKCLCPRHCQILWSSVSLEVKQFWFYAYKYSPKNGRIETTTNGWVCLDIPSHIQTCLDLLPMALVVLGVWPELIKTEKLINSLENKSIVRLSGPPNQPNSHQIIPNNFFLIWIKNLYSLSLKNPIPQTNNFFWACLKEQASWLAQSVLYFTQKN